MIQQLDYIILNLHLRKKLVQFVSYMAMDNHPIIISKYLYFLSKTATYFAKRGYTINMIDLRGFGYSGGFRVNNSIKGTLSDIGILLTRCC